MRIVCSILACLVLANAGQAQQSRPDVYLIEPGDQLSIAVLEDPGLNTNVLVRPDGRITLPLAGVIVAEGRAPEDLAVAIRRALARDFVAPPTVTVALTSLGERGGDIDFFVLGEVGRPGRYSANAPLTILEALALSGGPREFAATERIQLRRIENGTDTVIFFNYETVLDGAVPAGRIQLRDGDLIVIPQRGLFE